MTYLGSEWNKWDLQVQPIKDEWFKDLDAKRAEIKNATREYLTKAVEQDVSVVAITDHNCGVAVDSAYSLINEENINVKVLAGVEIDQISGYQLLVIFNPDYKTVIGKSTWEETIEHFLNNVCELPSPVFQDNVACSINGDVHKILERICSEDIGVPFFAHSQSDKGLFKKTTPANRKSYLKGFTDKRYYFVFDHKTNEQITTTQQTIDGWGFDSKIFPYIKTSDAHSASDVGSIYTWIKAEPTYEGLKQIVYDPISRTSIGTNEPTKPTNKIEGLVFNINTDAKINLGDKEEDFCFAGFQETLYLNPYFNCFIGGRGSGKSTILNFLGQHSNNPKSSIEFWKKINPSFKSADDSVFNIEGIGNFEYIGQSEVEKFATDQGAFTNAIYERANALKSGVLESKGEELGVELNKLSKFQETIASAEKLNEDLEEKEKEQKIVENSIKITESEEYTGITSVITEKSNSKQELESWRETINTLKESAEEFEFDDEDDNTEVSDLAKPYYEAYAKAKKNIENVTSILDESNFIQLTEKEKTLQIEISAEEEKLSKLLKKSGLSEENILQVKAAPQKLVQIKEEISKIKKQIKDLEIQISGYSLQLAKCSELKSEFETTIIDAINPLSATLKSQAEENDSEDIREINLQYLFDQQQAWILIANEVYTYFTQFYESVDRADLFKSFIIDKKDVFAGKREDILSELSNEKNTQYMGLLKAIFENDYDSKIFEVIRDKHLSDTNSYKQIEVLYDDVSIDRASFGQRCTAVIVILLLFGNYPLVIDEPEAHLDSSLIANYLVPLIKKTKVNRQIIFATHNANFVVNGDAEKIFILKNETGQTEISETTIENLDHRNNLLKLEGGREAFKKRGEKLHI